MNSDGLTKLQGWGVMVLRVVVGLVFLMHGGQKLFIYRFQNVGGMMGQLGIPLPMLSAAVVTVLEFFGGAALVLGLLTRWVAALIAFEMLVAVLGVHLKGGFFLPGGYEYPLTLLAANIALALVGPGAAALDTVTAKRQT